MKKANLRLSLQVGFSGGGVLDSQPCSVLKAAGEPWKTLVKFTIPSIS
jgi:hypothetical protein